MAQEVNRRETWTEHLREHGRDYFLSLIAALVIAMAGSIVWDEFAELRLNRQETTDWFEYFSLTYVGEDPDGRAGLGSLVIESDSAIYRSIELRFQDTLLCRQLDSTGPRTFVSQNADTGSFAETARPRGIRPWLFNADYPRNRDCIVRSTIYGTVEGITKALTIESEPFTIEQLP